MDFNEGDNEEMGEGLDDIINRMKALLDQMPKEMKVLEEPISPEYTEAYMQNLQAYREKKKEAGEDAPILEMPDIDDLALIQESHPDKLKDMLMVVSEQGTVEAFRILEKFGDQIKEDQYPWWRLAVSHCQLHIENSLRDEPIGFIASGLGGKDNKLRYYTVVMATDDMDVGQQRWVEQEFYEQAPQNDIEVELVETDAAYILVRMLVPWNFVVLEYLQQVVQQCTFIREEFFITNCERPSEEEILNWRKNRPE